LNEQGFPSKTEQKQVEKKEKEGRMQKPSAQKEKGEKNPM